MTNLDAPMGRRRERMPDWKDDASMVSAYRNQEDRHDRQGLNKQDAMEKKSFHHLAY